MLKQTMFQINAAPRSYNELNSEVRLQSEHW